MVRRGMFRWPLAVAAVLCVTLMTASARAGSVSAGGWTASWSDALDDVLGLTVLSTGNDNVRFNKFAQFTRGPEDGAIEPLVITFKQTAPDAKRFVVIEQESVINDTGIDWQGFDFILAPPAATGLRFDEARTFGGANPFDIDPFDDYTLSANGKMLSLSGGIVPNVGDDVWEPGQAAGGLWIDAAPLAQGNRAFEFKERPVPIPLPAAAFTGLITLGGAGLLGKLRSRFGRRQTA